MGNSIKVEPFEEDPTLFSNFSNLARQSSSKFLNGKNDASDDRFRFISLNELIAHNEFPRSPLDNDRTALMSRHDLLNAFVVFVSHTWLRGSQHTPGFTGIRHPDREDNEKYKLTVEALIKIHRIYAPAFEDIWVWMDYGCINQNNNPSDSYNILSDVIYLSDCLLTPIVDDNANTWSYDPNKFNALTDYRSPSFFRGSHCFLNRAWCRLEMFFAANLPVKNCGFRKQVSKSMQLFTLNGARPHFLYGTKESLEEWDPVLMNEMTKELMEQFDPRKGQLTFSSDEIIIESVVEKELQILLDANKPCYRGERNDLLQKHGKGYTVEENGDIYEGEYDTSKKHGYGKMVWKNGDVYEGQWVHNYINGFGRMVYADNEIYEGEWKDELRHGKGKVTYTDGSEYEGDFVEGRMIGHGRYLYSDGSCYEGDIEDGIREGYGVMIYSNLDVYRGEFVKGNLHGKGTYRDSKGNEYTGEWNIYADMYVLRQGIILLLLPPGDWVDNEKDGEGVYKYASGKVYEGEWCDNKKHGEGVLTTVDGGKYAGRWKKGVWKG